METNPNYSAEETGTHDRNRFGPTQIVVHENPDVDEDV